MLKKLYKKEYRRKLTDVQLSYIFHGNADKHGKGKIDFNELMIVTLFNMADVNANGKLTVREFKNASNMFVEPNEDKITEEQAKEVLKEFDSNNDGELSYEEYRRFMKYFDSDDK